MVLKSEPRKVVLAKILGTVLCAGVSLLILGESFPGVGCLLALPFILIAFFTGSLAILQVREGILYYKRLVNWKPIHEDEIVSARIEWPPIIGSIRMKRFLLPWGRLYFILDANSRPNPFHEGTYPLFEFVRKTSAFSGSRNRRAEPRDPNQVRLLRFRVAVGAAAGALVYCFTRLAPARMASPPFYSHMPIGIAISWQLIGLLQNIKIISVLCAAFTILAVYRYQSKNGWLFAFLAGAAIPHIIAHWLAF